MGDGWQTLGGKLDLNFQEVKSRLPLHQKDWESFILHVRLRAAEQIPDEIYFCKFGA